MADSSPLPFLPLEVKTHSGHAGCITLTPTGDVLYSPHPSVRVLPPKTVPHPRALVAPLTPGFVYSGLQTISV